ncbi:MAG: helix-turn-helix domain-containing protein [Hyphomicrobiales bacterium]|nr:helix-turn-helix domain-containing protein [Rickettsiales bacterium]MCP5361024.1 helix-turn-helix domain-containing protein [Hyphomicrobiales bacterium]
MQPNLIPFKDWCDSHHIGRTTGYKILNSGEIKAIKIGNKTYISREEDERYINSLPAYMPRKVPNSAKQSEAQV